MTSKEFPYVCEECNSQFETEEELDSHSCNSIPEEAPEELTQETKEETQEPSYDKGIFHWKECIGSYAQVLSCIKEKYPEDEKDFIAFSDKFGNKDLLQKEALGRVLGSNKIYRRTRRENLTEAYEKALEEMESQICPICHKQVIEELSEPKDQKNKYLKGSEEWRKHLDEIPKTIGQHGQIKQDQWSEIVKPDEPTGFHEQNKEFSTGIEGIIKGTNTIKIVINHIQNSHSPTLAEDFFKLWFGKYKDITNETGEPINPKGTGNPEQCSKEEIAELENERLEQLSKKYTEQGTLTKEERQELFKLWKKTKETY